MAIPDAQDVRGHTVAATGQQKPLHSLLELHTKHTHTYKCSCRLFRQFLVKQNKDFIQRSCRKIKRQEQNCFIAELLLIVGINSNKCVSVSVCACRQVYMCVSVCAGRCVCVGVDVCMRVCKHVSVSGCVCVHMCMFGCRCECACVYVCVCVSTVASGRP